MAKVAISNGHGINTPGKRTPAFPNGKVIKEWEFNHPTAKKIEKILKAHGVQTLMVSDTTIDTSLTKRVNDANRWGADVYVSVHYNAFQSKWGDHGGVETFAHSNSAKGKQIAKDVQANLVSASGLRDRGVKHNDRLYEIKATKMPAILVEAGFMDNRTEADLMLNDSYQEKVSEAIAKGVLKHFGIAYKGNSKPTEKPNISKPTGDTFYRVVTGSYSDRKNAEAQIEKLKKVGFKSFIDIYNK